MLLAVWSDPLLFAQCSDGERVCHLCASSVAPLLWYPSHPFPRAGAAWPIVPGRESQLLEVHAATELSDDAISGCEHATVECPLSFVCSRVLWRAPAQAGSSEAPACPPRNLPGYLVSCVQWPIRWQTDITAIGRDPAGILRPFSENAHLLSALDSRKKTSLRQHSVRTCHGWPFNQKEIRSHQFFA